MEELTYKEKVYMEVTELYDTGRFTQDDIAQKLNISIDAVRWCTKYYGFHNTKAKDGKNPIYNIKDLEDLEKLL